MIAMAGITRKTAFIAAIAAAVAFTATGSGAAAAPRERVIGQVTAITDAPPGRIRLIHDGKTSQPHARELLYPGDHIRVLDEAAVVDIVYLGGETQSLTANDGDFVVPDQTSSIWSGALFRRLMSLFPNIFERPSPVKRENTSAQAWRGDVIAYAAILPSATQQQLRASESPLFVPVVWVGPAAKARIVDVNGSVMGEQPPDKAGYSCIYLP